MNIKSKIKIDKYLGYFVASWVGLWARLLKKIGAANSKKTDSPRCILITKYQGMGSLVMAAPAIQRLKTIYPKSRFVFLGTKSTVPMAELMSEFDLCLTLEDSSLMESFKSILKLFLVIKKEPIDVVIDLEFYSNLAAVLSFLFGFNKNYGFVGEYSTVRSHLYTGLMFFNRHQYIGYSYWKLLQLASAADHFGAEDYEYTGWKDVLQEGSAFEYSKYVVLNIHASPLSFERKWPRSYFEAWSLDFISKNPFHKIILMGHGHAEVQEVEQFAKHVRIVNLAGKLNLAEVIQLIQQAELVISNDSAPLHLAQSLNVKTIGIFGPTLSQNYIIPTAQNVFVLQKKTYCSPCVHHWQKPPCRGDNLCMKHLAWTDLRTLTDFLIDPVTVGNSVSVNLMNTLVENSSYKEGEYLV